MRDLACGNEGCAGVFCGWGARANLASHRRLCDQASVESRRYWSQHRDWPEELTRMRMQGELPEVTL